MFCEQLITKNNKNEQFHLSLPISESFVHHRIELCVWYFVEAIAFTHGSIISIAESESSI